MSLLTKLRAFQACGLMKQHLATLSVPPATDRLSRDQIQEYPDLKSNQDSFNLNNRSLVEISNGACLV